MKHFIYYRKIRSVWRSLSREAVLTLIRALLEVRWTTATHFWLAWQEHCSVGCNQYLTPRLDWNYLFSATRSEHVMPLLRDLHWLKVPEQIQFSLCNPTYRCLHGIVPSDLAETLHLSSSVESCRRLHSRSTSTLLVPTTQRTTLGFRAFPVAGVWAWNALPASARTSSSYITFRQQVTRPLLRP